MITYGRIMEVKSSQVESDKMVEILKNQLYFAVIKGLSGKKIKSTTDALYFSIDEEFDYQNYYYDFGPYNISYLYKYCCKLKKYLQYSKGQKRVVHCTSTMGEKKVNSAFLIGAFSIIYLRIHPNDIYKALLKAGPFKQFMDASQVPCPYTVRIDYFFNAISKAIAFNFFNFDDFDVTEYDMYEKLQFGDMNWLVPRKFLAFIGPNGSEFFNGHPPDYYLKYFLKNDIKTVIRLNNKMYDSAVFTDAGITHYDLIYPDGSTPPKDVLVKFLHIAESAPAAIAVHCKAGLGRTGSLIGAYIIKHYQMTAKEAISWMRICRPGSVIGQQQVWLEKMEQWLWRCGNQYRCKHYGEGDKIPRHKYGIYSKSWPIERDKILRQARRIYLNQKSQSDVENLNHQKLISKGRNDPDKYQYHRFKKRAIIAENSGYEDISKFLTSVHGLGKNQAHKTMPTIGVLTAGPRESVLPKKSAAVFHSPEFTDPLNRQNQSSKNFALSNSESLNRHNQSSKHFALSNNQDKREPLYEQFQGDCEYCDYLQENVASTASVYQTDTPLQYLEPEGEMVKPRQLYVKERSKHPSKILRGTQGDRLNEIKATKKKRQSSKRQEYRKIFRESRGNEDIYDQNMKNYYGTNF